jgi:sterol 3beta-glucosyltransferase
VDQLFWDWTIQELGVGITPIPHRKLSDDRLARAILKAVINITMHQCAAELGSEIRVDKGIANEVEVIQRMERIKS